MRVLFPVAFALALYSAEADYIDIMVMDIPTGAPCLSGQLYNASNSPPCQDKHCDSGVAFGFDIDGKKPCCITCARAATPVPVCYKPWSHVTQIESDRSSIYNRIDQICTPGRCTIMVAKGTNKIIQSTEATPTPVDTCARFDSPGHRPHACADPVFTDPSTDPSSECWSMPESSGSSLSSGSSESWGLLQFGVIGAMLVGMV
jgi:hypothetical protein